MLRIKELRLERKLSIRKLAELVGLSNTTVLRAEKGERKLSTPQAIKLADFFGVSVDYLLGAEPEAMYDDFVDSIKRTFYTVSVDASGEATQGFATTIEPPFRTKLEILIRLQAIERQEDLDAIFKLVAALSAKADFN